MKQKGRRKLAKGTDCNRVPVYRDELDEVKSAPAKSINSFNEPGETRSAQQIKGR